MTVKADLEALYSAAIAALDAGEYTTAIKKAMAIKMRLLTSADLTADTKEIAWKRPSDADSFVADCRILQAAALHTSAGGIQMSKITYARVDDSGNYS